MNESREEQKPVEQNSASPPCYPPYLQACDECDECDGVGGFSGQTMWGWDWSICEACGGSGKCDKVSG